MPNRFRIALDYRLPNRISKYAAKYCSYWFSCTDFHDWPRTSMSSSYVEPMAYWPRRLSWSLNEWEVILWEYLTPGKKPLTIRTRRPVHKFLLFHPIAQDRNAAISLLLHFWFMGAWRRGKEPVSRRRVSTTRTERLRRKEAFVAFVLSPTGYGWGGRNDPFQLSPYWRRYIRSRRWWRSDRLGLPMVLFARCRFNDGI